MAHCATTFTSCLRLHCETASAKSFLAFLHGVRICHTSVNHTRLYRPASRRRNGARMEATVFNHALPLARASITFSVAPVSGRCVRDQYLGQKIPPPKTFRAQALMQRIPPATSRRHRRQIRTVSPHAEAMARRLPCRRNCFTQSSSTTGYSFKNACPLSIVKPGPASRTVNQPMAPCSKA